MITQSFLYNAIFFTYALVLTKVYGVFDWFDAVLLHLLLRRQPGRPVGLGAPVRHPRAPQE